jgi:hypothetical protein
MNDHTMWLLELAARVVGMLSEGVGVKRDKGGSGDGCCLWFLARCRVVKDSETFPPFGRLFEK